LLVRSGDIKEAVWSLVGRDGLPQDLRKGRNSCGQNCVLKRADCQNLQGFRGYAFEKKRGAKSRPDAACRDKIYPELFHTTNIYLDGLLRQDYSDSTTHTTGAIS